MITLTTEIDEIDAIDWDMPTMLPIEQRYYENQATSVEDRNPALCNFISAAAESIEDESEWKVFTDNLSEYEGGRH
jgi:hypothetical protein